MAHGGMFDPSKGRDELYAAEIDRRRRRGNPHQAHIEDAIEGARAEHRRRQNSFRPAALGVIALTAAILFALWVFSHLMGFFEAA